MKPGDLVVLHNIRVYQTWLFWSLEAKAIQKLLATGQNGYNLGGKDQIPETILGSVCEVIWVEPPPHTTVYIYAPALDMFTHIWKDCLKPLNP
jgi:hypothetical protein